MLSNRRDIVKAVAGGAILLSTGGAVAKALSGTATNISIQSDRFLINGMPTYPGRTFQGHRVEGLLFTSRMVNAIVDDQNPATRGLWAYMDGPWDPERNTRELIQNLPRYRACGLTSIALNVQGGNPMAYYRWWGQPWWLSGFTAEGKLRPDYGARLERVIRAADAQGMVVVLGFFYVSAKPALLGESAVLQAADDMVDFLCARGLRNVLVEIANECDIPSWKYDVIKPARAAELIHRVQAKSAGRLDTPTRRLLVSTSFAMTPPPDEVVAAVDYVLLHGNALSKPDALRSLVQHVRGGATYKGQPILFNEDDWYDFDKPDNNMLASVGEYTGWGFFDYRQLKEPFSSGYQSLPVDWGISSERKKAFFRLLAEITGGTAPA